MKKVHRTRPPSHTHICKTDRRANSELDVRQEGNKSNMKISNIFVSSLHSLLLLPLQSETAFLSYYWAHLLLSKDLVFYTTSGIKIFFVFSLECYMKLLAAAEDILITAVSYSLWNEKLFCLFICLFETNHSFRSFRKKKKEKFSWSCLTAAVILHYYFRSTNHLIM